MFAWLLYQSWMILVVLAPYLSLAKNEVENPFLNELTKLYEKSKDKGSVWVTMKRVHLDWKKKRKGARIPENEIPEFRCSVRATDGKRNISTFLSAKDYHRFQMAYATVLKAHMDALKKKEKKDKKEKKSAAVSKPTSSG